MSGKILIIFVCKKKKMKMRANDQKNQILIVFVHHVMVEQHLYLILYWFFLKKVLLYLFQFVGISQIQTVWGSILKIGLWRATTTTKVPCQVSINMFMVLLSQNMATQMLSEWGQFLLYSPSIFGGMFDLSMKCPQHVDNMWTRCQQKLPSS